MTRAAVAVVGATLLAAGCGGTTTTTVTVTTTRTVTTSAPSASASACPGNVLMGEFALVPGSAGAGNIVYRLTLTNASSAECWVSGLPVVQLLDEGGSPLPTHVSPAHPGAATAARIVLASGKSATADARFSPDVPGTGEPTQSSSGDCEPTAVSLRVTAPGGGTLDVPLVPYTPVCEHGALSFSLYTQS